MPAAGMRRGCEGADDVHERDERACAEDRAGQGAAGIADFFAHGETSSRR